MKTYQPGNNDNNLNKNNSTESDLPLGSVDRAYMDRKYQGLDTYTEKPKAKTSFMKQFFASIIPFTYKAYNGMNEKDGIAFVRWISFFYMLATYLTIVYFALMNPVLILEQTNNPDISVEFIQDAIVFIILGVFFLIAALIYPFIYRFFSMLLRWPARLMLFFFSKRIRYDHMYLVSIYAMVPAILINIGAGFCIGMPEYEMIRLYCRLFSVILPIVYSCIGVFVIE